MTFKVSVILPRNKSRKMQHFLMPKGFCCWMLVFDAIYLDKKVSHPQKPFYFYHALILDFFGLGVYIFHFIHA